MSDHGETLQAYDQHASEFADYFKGIGPRVDDIKLALELAGKSDGTADVLEIGCGDGRDAAEILKHVNSYVGIDYSKGLLDIAVSSAPRVDFRLQDLRTYDYPAESYDVVFAFASLLHVSKEEPGAVIKSVDRSLRMGGIFYISLKYSPEYKEAWKEDSRGKRLFYYYNSEIITDLSAGLLTPVYSSQETIGDTDWFEVALRK